MNYLGNQILKLRKREGLSQEEFADMINVSRQMVSKWELGESIPRASKVEIICDKFNISADQLFGTEESIGKNESHPVALKRLKIALKGIAIICLIVFAMYVLYALYKFCLLSYLENKFKQYDNWTNYYAEITTFEDGQITREVEIWYKDNKYKITRKDIFNNTEIVQKTKWIDCNEKVIEYFNKENVLIKKEKINTIEKYENGKYIKESFPWLREVCKNKIKKSLILNTISVSKNRNNNYKIVKFNNDTLSLSNDLSIPISYNDSTLEKIIFTYYNIKLNEVKDEDVEVKKDL